MKTIKLVLLLVLVVALTVHGGRYRGMASGSKSSGFAGLDKLDKLAGK